MRKSKAGFTLVELMTGMGVMSIVLLGSITLLSTGLKSFQKTSSDVVMTNQNANALRKISETLRQAINVTITNSGRTITYTLPKLGPVDPLTGEKELVEPIQGDGVMRSFNVDFTTGKLIAGPGNITLISKLSPKDMQVGSSQYNQTYVPFQLTTIGSYRAITITLITTDTVITDKRYMRMKTTAVVRNSN